MCRGAKPHVTHPGCRSLGPAAPPAAPGGLKSRPGKRSFITPFFHAATRQSSRRIAFDPSRSLPPRAESFTPRPEPKRKGPNHARLPPAPGNVFKRPPLSHLPPSGRSLLPFFPLATPPLSIPTRNASRLSSTNHHFHRFPSNFPPNSIL